MDLKETKILGAPPETHWYYKAKASACLRLVSASAGPVILDVGAGSGFFSRYLLKNTAAFEAWCIDINYSQESDEKEGNKSLHFRNKNPNIQPNLVLLMDILEHVEDDADLLAACIAQAAPGAYVLISVPAFQTLWSRHDVFLGHKRRYTLRQVKRLAKDSGLIPVQANYFFFGVFPIALMLRIFERLSPLKTMPKSQLKKHHPTVNAFLGWLCNLELSLMRFNRAFGLTVFFLGKKP